MGLLNQALETDFSTASEPMTVPEPQPAELSLYRPSGLVEMALAGQREQPQIASPGMSPRRRAIQDFTSDLMFTLAQSFAAGPERGAGISAAITGPMQRRTLVQQAQEHQTQLEQAAQKAQLDAEKSKLEIAKTRADLINSQRSFETRTVERNGKKYLEYFDKFDPSRVLYTSEVGVVDAPNIDPLSEEGIDAEVKKQTRLQGIKAGKEPDLTLEEQHVADRIAEAEENKGRPLTRFERIGVRTRAVEEYAKLKRDPSALDARQAAIETAKMVREDNLRDDYEKRIGDDISRSAAYDYINSVKNQPVGGAGDIALIYNFIKMQDPNAVRNEEIELVQSTGSLPDRWKRYLAGITEGAVLDDKTKQRLIQTADTMYKDAIRPRLEKANTEFSNIAKRRNLNPENIVRPVDGTSGMIRVTVDGKAGEIPSDQWESFKRKYPGATRQ